MIEGENMPFSKALQEEFAEFRRSKNQKHQINMKLKFSFDDEECMLFYIKSPRTKYEVVMFYEDRLSPNEGVWTCTNNSRILHPEASVEIPGAEIGMKNEPVTSPRS